MATTIPQPPMRDSILELPERPNEKPTGLASFEWIKWFLLLIEGLNAAPQQIRTVALANQSAAIATTAFPLPALQPGLYRVSWFLRIVQAATVSSSVAVTFGGTDAAVAYPQSGPAETGNTVSTVQSGEKLMRCDQATALTYATAYATVGATPMKYDLEIVVEKLQQS